jgi:microcystin-dependent protein
MSTYINYPASSGGSISVPLVPADGGTGTTTVFTPGSIVFATTSGVYAQDNANLFWDNTLNRLGIGTDAPTAALDVHGAAPLIQSTNTGAYSSGGGGFFQLIADAGSAMTSGSRLGTLQYMAAYDASATYNIGASIGSLATQLWTASANGAKLTFNVTANNSTSRTLALTLDQDASATFANTVNATTFVGAVSGTATNATNVAITDDTSTNATMYPTWVTANTGNLPQKVSSTKLTFNPSTATLTTTTFSGALSGNATTATTATNATNMATVAVSNSANYFPIFAASSSDSNQAHNLSASLIYNPSTGAMGTLNTTAAASKDFLISSGSPATSGASGAVSLKSGNTLSSSVSGAATLASGTSTNAASGAVTIQSGNSSGAGSGNITIQTGTAEANSAVGNITIYAQQTGVSQTAGLIDIKTGSRDNAAISLHTTNINGSGWVNVYSGDGTTAGSGRLNLYTGAVTTSTASGLVQLYTGSSTSATSGKVSIYTGTSTSGTSGLVEMKSGAGSTATGAVNITSGDASAGNSGAIALQTGTASGTRGSITLNAPTVAITGALTISTALAVAQGGTGVTTSASWLNPTGTVIMTAASSAPTGWLFTDGSAVSRTTYADLFSSIGTTYGTGDGSTTFNLPNTAGIFVRGAGTQTISSIVHTAAALGSKQNDQAQGHRHNQTAAGGGSTWDNTGGGASPESSTADTGDMKTDGTNGTPRTGTTTYPANITFNFIIKT